ncbi:hypothetical protein ACM66B_001660 [Microbotryomycetes sp. NB124-2]
MDKITHHVGPLFVALAVVLLSCCIASFYDVVFPYHFMRQDTSWPTFIIALAWTGYLVTMMIFHYYKAITVKPGSPLDPPALATRSWTGFVPERLCFGPLKRFNANSTRSSRTDTKRAKMIKQIQTEQQAIKQSRHELVTDVTRIGPSAVRREKKGRTCKKCDLVDGVRPPKPERSHHCKVCKTCILKFDHHCPWIKQCVGLHNERYFVLFLCYFSVSCGFAAFWGWNPMWTALDFGQWRHRTPRMFVPLTFILALILGLAVAIMAIYQIWLIACGETTVEAHDNEWYRKTAEIRRTEFKNPYDLGRRANLEYFFNVRPTGSFHWSTILLPVSVPAASDGWTWRKIPDWERYAMRLEDELTDEELGSDGEDIR